MFLPGGSLAETLPRQGRRKNSIIRIVDSKVGNQVRNWHLSRRSTYTSQYHCVVCFILSFAVFASCHRKLSEDCTYTINMLCLKVRTGAQTALCSSRVLSYYSRLLSILNTKFSNSLRARLLCHKNTKGNPFFLLLLYTAKKIALQCQQTAVGISRKKKYVGCTEKRKHVKLQESCPSLPTKHQLISLDKTAKCLDIHSVNYFELFQRICLKACLTREPEVLICRLKHRSQ